MHDVVKVMSFWYCELRFVRVKHEPLNYPSKQSLMILVKNYT